MSSEIIFYILRKNKRVLLGTFFLFAIVMGFVLMQRAPLFRAQALFKEANERQESPSIGLIKQLIDSNSSENEMPASAIMSSRTALRQVISELGLQSRPFMQARSINWSGNERLHFEINPIDELSYQVDGRVGRLNEKFHYKGASWILEEMPDATLKVALEPLEQTVDRSLRRLRIVRRKEENHLLEIFFSHENRFVASAFVNRLMEVYKEYLQKDYQLITASQIAYLENRQQEVSKTFDHHLEEYVHFLKENLGEEGFINLSSEINFVKEKKRVMSERMLELELFSQKERDADLRSEEDSLGLGEKFRKLHLKKEALSRSFTENRPDVDAIFPILQRKEELNREDSLKKIHEKISFLKFQNGVESAQYALKKLKVDAYLEKNRRLEGIERSKRFEGIDLEMASLIYEKLQETLQVKQERVSRLQYALQWIEENPSFELSAFSGVFTDPIGTQLIAKAGEIMGQMRDEKNLMVKDQSRLVDALKKERLSLINHGKHQLASEKKEIELTEKNLKELNAMTFDLINQESYFLQEQYEKMKADKLKLLDREKALLQEKLDQMRKTMEGFPQKWLMENRLQLKAEMIMGVMESISHLVESKNVEYHLRQFESKPIDFAYVPQKSQPTFDLLYSLLFGSVGFLGMASFLCLRSLKRGLPIVKAHFLSQNGATLDQLRQIWRELAQNAPLRLAIYTNGYETDLAPRLVDYLRSRGRKVHYLENNGAPEEMTFQSLKEEGDLIFTITAPISSEEALCYCEFWDRALFCLRDETQKHLDPYPQEKIISLIFTQ